MNKLKENVVLMMIVYREFLHLLYLMLIQFRMIFPYWILGVFLGSLVSVFLSGKIYSAASRLRHDKYLLIALLLASTLGAASPICMYGTIPLIAVLGRRGVPQYLLAAFMVSSILINPNLFFFSFVLGGHVAVLRLVLSISAGVISGILIKTFYKRKALFNFEGFEEATGPRTKTPGGIVFLKDMHRCIIKTAPYFIIGIALTALFERYFTKGLLTTVLNGNKVLEVLLATALGVPVYVCGGGVIPLLKAWMDAGMSLGSALAFMIAGSATKLTNLSAVKIILGVRNFILYIGFNMLFAIAAGLITDLIAGLIR